MEYKINPSTFGVVIVDVQENFLNNIWKINKKRLINNHRKLLNLCSKKEIPVTALSYEGGGEYPPELKDYLSKYPKESFIDKRDTSGFSNPSLERRLHNLGLKEILYTGLNAHACVLSTLLDGIGKGITPVSCGSLVGDTSGYSGISHAKKEFKKRGVYFSRYSFLSKALD